MKARLLWVLCAACVVALLSRSPLAFASEPPGAGAANDVASAFGVFAGQARDLLTGKPVPGAIVWLKDTLLEVRADSGGYFRLLAPPGTWELAIRAPGYLTMSRVLLRSLPGKTVGADFDLVVENPDPAQESELSRLMIAPPEQAIDSGVELTLAASAAPSTIRVLMSDGQVVEMDLDEYLKGVVPWEMPPSAPLEALKAQAVAARSYAVTSWNHAAQGAHVCTTTHCQVWNNIRFSRTDQAVEETKGIFAAYSGNIIRAFFFGHCDGHTRNSEDVWVQALPYLRSVACECGFTTMWGHGVGMCQEGAIAMARRGASFDAILRHYYTGTSVLGMQPTPTPAPSVTPTSTPNLTVSITYSLQAGWNLIGIPVDLAETSVPQLLAPISGKYDLVMQFDAFAAYSPWKAYDATVGVQSGGLEYLDIRYGIWMRATEPCTLTLTGVRPQDSTSVPLQRGLNLAGYPSLQTRPITDALSSIEGRYIRVYTYDASQPGSPWRAFDFTVPAAVNSLTEMKPGQAYWIEMVEPAMWSVEP